MNPKQESRHMVDILFVLTLFLLFAVSALMLVMVGARVYQNTVNDMASNFDERTAFAYVTERIRQNNDANTVSVGTLEDVNSLILSQKVDGETYETYLYLHDGYLKELFIKKGSYLGENMLNAGQKILELKAFQVESIQDSLYRIFFESAHSDPMTLYVHVQN